VRRDLPTRRSSESRSRSLSGASLAADRFTLNGGARAAELPGKGRHARETGEQASRSSEREAPADAAADLREPERPGAERIAEKRQQADIRQDLRIDPRLRMVGQLRIVEYTQPRRAHQAPVAIEKPKRDVLFLRTIGDRQRQIPTCIHEVCAAKDDAAALKTSRRPNLTPGRLDRLAWMKDARGEQRDFRKTAEQLTGPRKKVCIEREGIVVEIGYEIVPRRLHQPISTASGADLVLAYENRQIGEGAANGVRTMELLGVDMHDDFVRRRDAGLETTDGRNRLVDTIEGRDRSRYRSMTKQGSFWGRSNSPIGAEGMPPHHSSSDEPVPVDRGVAAPISE
jgi:hypothetical protein